MKKFLFVLRDGDTFANATLTINRDLPNSEDIEYITDTIEHNEGGNFIVIDFKEISND